MTLVQTGEKIEVAARDFPTNNGGLCRKGWTAAELLRALGGIISDRVTRVRGLQSRTLLLFALMIGEADRAVTLAVGANAPMQLRPFVPVRF
jgi:nitrate/nitrite transporter NarK